MMRIVDYTVVWQSTYGNPEHTVQVYANKKGPTFAQLVKEAIGNGWVPFGNMTTVNHGRDNFVVYSQPMVKYEGPDMRHLVLGNSKNKTRRRRST